jgi:heme/copper-type cytochrome/quinol oxidase subunit 4
MKKFIATALATLAPVIALAQTSGAITDANKLVEKLTNLGNTFIQILIAFAVIYIIYNVVRYLVMGGDDEEKRKKAGQAILWGVVGLFVILSIWGLVRILTNTFRTDTTTPANIPQITYPTKF